MSLRSPSSIYKSLNMFYYVDHKLTSKQSDVLDPKIGDSRNLIDIHLLVYEGLISTPRPTPTCLTG